MQLLTNLWGKLTTDVSENTGEGARLFEEGIQLYTARNYAGAKIQYEEAIKHGNLEARDELAWILRYGREGMPSDLIKSNRLVRAGHELGSPHCSGILSLDRTQSEMKEKVRLANIGAHADSKYGWYALGVIFNMYKPEDYTKAHEYFLLAANKFDLDMAHYELGEMYLHGKDGVEQNEKEAFRRFQLAANQGLPHAYYKVAWCYEHGVGLRRNLKKALENYKMAQSAGIVNSDVAPKIRDLTRELSSRARSTSRSGSSSGSDKTSKSRKANKRK